MARRRDKEDLAEPGLTDENGNTGSPTPTEAMNQPTLGSSPTPAEAEKAVGTAGKEAEGKPEEAPKRELPSVPLRVFGSVSGIKADQFQPFARYAFREEMRPCPIPEWKERYTAFQNKPTKPRGN